MVGKKDITVVTLLTVVLFARTSFLAGFCFAMEKVTIRSPVATYEFGERGTAYKDFEIKGLTFAQDRLWVLDKAKNVLREYDPVNRNTVKTYPAPCKNPHGLSWDGARLLVPDEKTHEVHVVNPLDGSSDRMVDLNKCSTSTKLPVLPKDLPDLTAVTWDGKYLWAAFTAGYSSSIFKVDPKKGTIEQHMWAHGPNPEGLFWDGTYLVSIDARNKEIRKLDKNGNAAQIAALPSEFPHGLTFDGSFYWYFDAKRSQFLKIDLPK